MNLRKASEADYFPYTSPTTAYIVLRPDQQPEFFNTSSKSNSSDLVDCLDEAASGTNTTVLAVWPGKWRSDAFLIDNPDTAIEKITEAQLIARPAGWLKRNGQWKEPDPEPKYEWETDEANPRHYHYTSGTYSINLQFNGSPTDNDVNWSKKFFPKCLGHISDKFLENTSFTIIFNCIGDCKAASASLNCSAPVIPDFYKVYDESDIESSLVIVSCNLYDYVRKCLKLD